VGNRGSFGPKAGVGIDAAGVAELAYTAATGASNRHGLNREQAAEVLRQASRSVSAQSGDRGVKSAAEDFTARLDRGFTVQEARSTEAALRNTRHGRARTIPFRPGPGTPRPGYLGAGLRCRPGHRRYAALADIRQTDPARFRGLVEEAHAAWAASGEGQSQITQGGAIAPPRATDDVFSQGIGDRNQLADGGRI
jgi:hypothetical protein